MKHICLPVALLCALLCGFAPMPTEDIPSTEEWGRYTLNGTCVVLCADETGDALLVWAEEPAEGQLLARLPAACLEGARVVQRGGALYFLREESGTRQVTCMALQISEDSARAQLYSYSGR